MPNPTNNPDTLVRGLSSFWLRMFNDRSLLDGLYRSTEQQLGQAYFDLLETVLGRSLDATPLYHREYWHLFAFREDSGVPVVDGASVYYQYELDAPVADVQFLCDQLLVPSLLLEKDVDFSIVTTSSGSAIRFLTGNPFVGSIPRTRVPITPVVLDSGGEGQLAASNGVLRFMPRAGYVASDLDIGRTLTLTSGPAKGTWVVRGYVGAVLELGPTTLPNATHDRLGWDIRSSDTTRVAALWGQNTYLDYGTLASNFGVLVQQVQASSEPYRLLLRGLMRYFTCGPTLVNIEAALNLAAGIPVVESDGEVVTALENDSVTTSRKTYLLPTNSRKAALSVGQTLPAFAPLTDCFKVVDDVSDPLWWRTAVLPVEALPYESVDRRAVSPDMVANAYNVPVDLVRYGDPGVFYGADDTGRVPAGGRMALRHNFAYAVMDRVLKHNTVGLTINSTLLPPGVTVSPLEDIVRQGLPAHVFLVTTVSE